MAIIEAEQPQNYEQKCPCVLVLDVSGSMGGEPIGEVNNGLDTLKAGIIEDSVARERVRLAIVTFSDVVQVVREFDQVESMDMPKLEAGGTTKLVDGVRQGIELVNKEKSWLRKTGQTCYRPYVILVTDGGPDSDQDMQGLKKELADGAEGKHFNFWAFGVGGADMNVLKELSPTAPMLIKEKSFKGFFEWLSASLKVSSNSKTGENLDLSPGKVIPDKANPFQIVV